MADPLLLQRRRADGDARRWRTVLRVPRQRIADATQVVRLADGIDPRLSWRLSAADCSGWALHWLGDRWGEP